MKKILITIPLAFLLVACGTPSVKVFMEDPELLGEAVYECTMLMAQGKDINTEKCNNALEAQKQIAQNMIFGSRGK